MTTTNGNEKRPLPEGWEWQTISSLTNSMKNGIYKPKEYYSNDGVACLRMYNIDDGQIIWKDIKRMILTNGELEAYKLVPGDILVNRVNSRELVGKAAVIPKGIETCVYESKNIRLRLKKCANSAYIGYWFQNFRQTYFNHNAQQTVGMASINQEQLGNMPIPLAPSNEQTKIVAEIEKQFTRLDKAVAGLERVQANLDRYKASVLKAACEGRLVPQNPNDEPAEQLLQRILVESRRQWEAQAWQSQIERAQKKVAQARRKAAGLPHYIRDLEPEDWQAVPEAEYAAYLPKNEKWKQKYQEPEGVKTADLPELPEGWVWVRVEQLSTLIQYGTSDKASVENKGIPVLRMGNIQDGALDFGSLKYMPEDWDGVANLRLNDGDIIFNRTNSAELVGKTAVYKHYHPETTFASYLIRVKVASGVSPDFLSFYINSVYGRMYIASVVSQQVGQANVNGTKLANMPIPLPPFAEQKRIVAEVERRLSVITATQQLIDANLTRAARLRQSILQQAFSGQLVSN